MKVAVFVGTRADLGPLDPVIEALDRAPDIDVDVLCGVAYGASDLEAHLANVEYQGEVRELATPMTAITADSMLQQGARVTEGCQKLFEAAGYDTLVVLGDRWELLYIAPAALLYGIKIVHIHGGEVTEGAIDERVRHAVTKLADVHCVASIDAANRVRQMGEPDDRIHVTGAPGLDRLVSVAPYSELELEAVLGREIQRPLGLFTYHPPTAVAGVSLGTWVADALAASLEHFGTLIVTDPGIDEGREIILDTLDKAAQSDKRIVRVQSLGRHYPRVLAAVDAVVGNSSSGVIEAATVRVPAVDIGSRQEGRLRASSVLHADDSFASVDATVRSALAQNLREVDVVNPYGTGDAALRIVDAIRDSQRMPFGKKFQNQGDYDG
ncbi:UDP-N-acetylglucosamine 2-epimerase [Microbacterium sp. A93]|uniref:UDP-N-acetylglucosamine 2-epimerase n=1 Tax=Microbacterium sp. A93 TaxID=3450716 RepID=UPI003F4222CD